MDAGSGLRETGQELGPSAVRFCKRFATKCPHTDSAEEGGRCPVNFVDWVFGGLFPEYSPPIRILFGNINFPKK